MTTNFYTEDEVERMNKTSRCTGAVGAKALVPRVVDGVLSDNLKMTVLDYGAGKDAYHTKNLRARHWHEGHTIVAYDIGDNVIAGLHEPTALDLPEFYDMVYASCVLNVQESQQAMLNVLAEVKRVLKPGGVFICNYPASPRKSDVGVDRLEYLLSWCFGGELPIRVGGTKQAPVWKVEKVSGSADFA
jgi:SAM-dependent methyltransferase